MKYTDEQIEEAFNQLKRKEHKFNKEEFGAYSDGFIKEGIIQPCNDYYYEKTAYYYQIITNGGWFRYTEKEKQQLRLLQAEINAHNATTQTADLVKKSNWIQFVLIGVTIVVSFFGYYQSREANQISKDILLQTKLIDSLQQIQWKKENLFHLQNHNVPDQSINATKGEQKNLKSDHK